MAIRFKHEAAAVVPPPNTITRKYGQQLVLQQQAQKYQRQQDDINRMYDAARQQSAQMFQLARDQQQNNFQLERDQQQNNFVLGRDSQEFERRQQYAQEQAYRKMLEDAMKQSGRFITDSIDNGEYDPATANELRQNMAAEAMVLRTPQLDPTQRAEALDNIRRQRIMLTTARQPREPQLDAQQRFNESIVTDPQTGERYRLNAKGDYEPMPQQQQRPMSADEAFRADQKIFQQYMEEAKTILTEGGAKPLTRDMRRQAAAMARELYDEDNGFGQPTLAPELPGGVGDGQQRGNPTSILETPIGTPNNEAASGTIPTQDEIVSALLEGRFTYDPNQGMGMDSGSNQMGDIAPIPNWRGGPADVATIPNWQGGPANVAPIPNYPQQSKSAQVPTTEPALPQAPQPNQQAQQSILEQPPQNQWSEVMAATPDAGESPSPTPTQRQPLRLGKPTSPNAQPPMAAAPDPGVSPLPMEPTQQPATVPDFQGLMVKARGRDDERRQIAALQGMYSTQPPEVQNAIRVVLDTGSSDDDFAQAYAMLLKNNIDLEQLGKQKAPSSGRKGKNR